MRVGVLVTGALLAAVTTSACAQILGGFDNRDTGGGGAGAAGGAGGTGGGGAGGATSTSTSSTSSGTSSSSSSAASSSGSPKQNGDPCAQGNECASGNCAPHGDGTSVCCVTACATPCMTCDGSGTCGDAAASFADARCGPQAMPQCTQNSVQLCACDGMGACKLKTGAYCMMDADCLNGTCVWMSPAAECN